MASQPVIPAVAPALLPTAANSVPVFVHPTAPALTAAIPTAPISTAKVVLLWPRTILANPASFATQPRNANVCRHAHPRVLCAGLTGVVVAVVAVVLVPSATRLAAVSVSQIVPTNSAASPMAVVVLVVPVPLAPSATPPSSASANPIVPVKLATMRQLSVETAAVVSVEVLAQDRTCAKPREVPPPAFVWPTAPIGYAAVMGVVVVAVLALQMHFASLRAVCANPPVRLGSVEMTDVVATASTVPPTPTTINPSARRWVPASVYRPVVTAPAAQTGVAAPAAVALVMPSALLVVASVFLTVWARTAPSLAQLWVLMAVVDSVAAPVLDRIYALHFPRATPPVFVSQLAQGSNADLMAVVEAVAVARVSTHAMPVRCASATPPAPASSVTTVPAEPEPVDVPVSIAVLPARDRISAL